MNSDTTITSSTASVTTLREIVAQPLRLFGKVVWTAGMSQQESDRRIHEVLEKFPYLPQTA